MKIENFQKPMKQKTQTKIMTLPLIGTKTNDLTWTVGLVLAAIIAPAIFAHTPQNQWVTGTLVNTALFLAAFRLPFANAVLVAIVPSTIALSRGLLPLPMAMLIPYIMIANVLLISVFKGLNKKPLIGVIIASLVKFSFLYVLTLIVASKLSSPLIVMLQWPQLITALAGGFLALAIIKTFLTKKNLENQSH